MDAQELLAWYVRSENGDRLRFLLTLSHQMTIFARGAYADERVENEAKLIGVNELQHRLVSFCLDLIDDSRVHSGQWIVEYLVTATQELGAAWAMQEAREQS